MRDVQLFVEPDAGAKPVTSAIAAATRSVWVEVYLLTDAPVIAALEDARSRGVDVRVMLEEHPYGYDVVAPQRTLQILTTAGIRAKFANSAYTYTHAKMLIIDGAILFILTANLSQSGLGGSNLPDMVFTPKEKVYTYGVMAIEGNTLAFDVYSKDGRKIDFFKIKKPSSTTKNF